MLLRRTSRNNSKVYIGKFRARYKRVYLRYNEIPVESFSCIETEWDKLRYITSLRYSLRRTLIL